MADFKKDFANHINVIGTNPYLFIGSGLSRRYLNMPTWLNLLKDFSEKLLLQKGFGYYDSKSEGNLPELASLMASEFHETWWTNPAFSDSRKEYENKRIGSQEIPFKIELSKFVSNHKDFQEDYSEEIELLKKVVIDGIITTNWDTFLEATFSDYKTYIGQEQLLFSENISIGEIYKIHGCVTSPESLIVSSNDYANFKKRNAYLAAKLLTIFVEHPVIFLGYSISDPNILELLFSLKDCFNIYNNCYEKEIISVGGGAKSKAWLQIQADIFNKKIISLKNEEGPSLGAAIVAAVSLNWFDSFEDAVKLIVKEEESFYPNKELVEIYEEVYNRYRKIYKCIKNI